MTGSNIHAPVAIELRKCFAVSPQPVLWMDRPTTQFFSMTVSSWKFSWL